MIIIINYHTAKSLYLRILHTVLNGYTVQMFRYYYNFVEHKLYSSKASTSSYLMFNLFSPFALHNNLKTYIKHAGIQVTPYFWVNFDVSKLNVPFVFKTYVSRITNQQSA
jgi:hypothetical protein